MIFPCLKRSALLKVLKELPKTLDESYNRILLSIPEEYHHDARSDLTYHVKRIHQSSVKIKFQNGSMTEVEKGERMVRSNTSVERDSSFQLY